MKKREVLPDEDHRAVRCSPQFLQTVESCRPFIAFIVSCRTGLPFWFSLFVWEESLGVHGVLGRLVGLGVTLASFLLFGIVLFGTFFFLNFFLLALWKCIFSSVMSMEETARCSLSVYSLRLNKLSFWVSPLEVGSPAALKGCVSASSRVKSFVASKFLLPYQGMSTGLSLISERPCLWYCWLFCTVCVGENKTIHRYFLTSFMPFCVVVLRVLSCAASFLLSPVSQFLDSQIILIFIF